MGICTKEDHSDDPERCLKDMASSWLQTESDASQEKLAEAAAKVEKYGERTAEVVWQKAGIGKGDQERLSMQSGGIHDTRIHTLEPCFHMYLEVRKGDRNHNAHSVWYI